MRNLKTLAAVVSGLLATTLASAATVTINGGPYQAGNGGEYTVTPNGNAGAVGLLSDLNAHTFESFCVETNEYLNFGHTYTAVINTAAVSGGSGGGSPDPLDARTAYLYWNFRMGTLAGYNYGGTESQRRNSAEALQKAIWYLENESGGKKNDFVTLANNAVNSGAWTGIGNVRILNLTDRYGCESQDILTVVPAPAALVLGALGLAGAFGLKRRLA